MYRVDTLPRAAGINRIARGLGGFMADAGAEVKGIGVGLKKIQLINLGF
jgi:hypothetical protein